MKLQMHTQIQGVTFVKHKEAILEEKDKPREVEKGWVPSINSFQ